MAKEYVEPVKGGYLECYEYVSQPQGGVESSLRYASSMFKEAPMGRRLWALFLDNLGAWLLANAIEPHDLSKRFFLQLGILFLEISLLTALQGASFGQMAARLKVIDIVDGSNLSIPRVLLRTLFIILVLPAIFRHNGRSIHDIVTRSIVVKFYKKVG